jgi:hypothetical protein
VFNVMAEDGGDKISIASDEVRMGVTGTGNGNNVGVLVMDVEAENFEGTEGKRLDGDQSNA